MMDEIFEILIFFLVFCFQKKKMLISKCLKKEKFKEKKKKKSENKANLQK